jgi:hypothetical protein
MGRGVRSGRVAVLVDKSAQDVDPVGAENSSGVLNWPLRLRTGSSCDSRLNAFRNRASSLEHAQLQHTIAGDASDTAQVRGWLSNGTPQVARTSRRSGPRTGRRTAGPPAARRPAPTRSATAAAAPAAASTPTTSAGHCECVASGACTFAPQRFQPTLPISEPSTWKKRRSMPQHSAPVC